MAAEELTLARLREEHAELERQGHSGDALVLLRRLVSLEEHFYGLESDEAAAGAARLVHACNLEALAALRGGGGDGLEHAGALLREARERLAALPAGDPLRALTLSNLGEWHRAGGELKAAAGCLKQALGLQVRLLAAGQAGVAPHLADNHLAMCAVLSALDAHARALAHAQEALILLQAETLQPTARSGADLAHRDARLQVMAVAHHSVAVELEHQRQLERALGAFRKCLEVVDTYLDPVCGTAEALRESCEGALAGIAQRIRKERRRARADFKAGSRVTGIDGRRLPKVQPRRLRASEQRDFISFNKQQTHLGGPSRGSSGAPKRRSLSSSAGSASWGGLLPPSAEGVRPGSGLSGVGSGSASGED